MTPTQIEGLGRTLDALRHTVRHLPDANARELLSRAEAAAGRIADAKIALDQAHRGLLAALEDLDRTIRRLWTPEEIGDAMNAWSRPRALTLVSVDE